jgi:flagellar basal body-associated protein FliL
MKTTRDSSAEPEITSKDHVVETAMDEDETSATETDPKTDGSSMTLASTEKRRWWTRKWLQVGVAGIFLTLGAVSAALFLVSRHDAPAMTSGSKILAKLPGATEALPATAETLPDFLLPLETNNKNVVLRVSLDLHWPQEVRTRFMQRQVAIRSKIYHRLGEFLASGMITRQGSGLAYKQKTQLEGEITRIFERELGQHQLIVSIRKIDFL